MKLTKNSWHYNAYLFLTGKEPNNNFCDYFWELLFNLIFFIPNLPFYLFTMVYSKYEKANKVISWNEDNYEWVTEPKTYKEKLIDNNKIPLSLKISVCFAIYFLFILLAQALIASVTNVLLALLSAIGFVVCLYGIVYFFTESETKDKIANNLSEIKDMTVKAFNSFKNNYCPKIDWTDKN